MRLLVVEDDLELANGLVNALGQSHHAAEAVHTAQSAMSACAVTQYDLIILDLTLPDSDGIELMRRLRQERGLVTAHQVKTAHPPWNRAAGLHRYRACCLRSVQAVFLAFTNYTPLLGEALPLLLVGPAAWPSGHSRSASTTVLLSAFGVWRDG